MSELCLSSTPKTPQFSTLLLSHLHLFFSLILSHPLYFSYFIFFSPYLLKLLSFLSPLFITTSLLLLGFLTLSPPKLPESESGFFLSTYHSITDRLRSKTDNEDGEFRQFEELEVYRIVFDTTTFNSDEVLQLGSEKTVEIDWEETKPVIEEKRLEGFLKELDDFEKVTANVEEKKADPPGIKSDKVEVNKEVVLVRSGSEAMGDQLITDNGGEHTSKKFLESPSSQTFASSLGSYGSMRKEKEWKRTLACKLFEERHNVDGGEGMDLLWETYENDSSNKSNKPNGNTKKNKNKKKSDFKYYEGDDYEEDEIESQLCCLQALKFSAGKMNLGMGRPNLVKFSKAIKGIGWLHNVTRSGKKKSA
ncbi:uncharacterized protein LOC130771005 [Actinidia eriantha]|uniref:uncharacterized protein LOC130771005 n=1 Tax=Actinidia eriantha TaxID=165200 RepID=UPI0025888699|nr:uncharacterized protein LOC130771005 [Actinidia eriantha]